MTDPDDLEPESVALTGPEIPRSASGVTTPGGEDEELDDVNAHLALEIDPDLLEAALAAVDRAHRKPARASRAPVAAMDVDLESAARPAAVPERPAAAVRRPEDDRLLALNARLREQGERLAVLEDELRRVSEGRALAESQLSEIRTTLRTHGEDFDRFRQRARKDREEAEKVGEERVLRSFLETANNVERAWGHAQANPGQLLTGLQMIVEQFRATLRKTGVERIPARPGTAFDPEVHEAVLRVPSPDHPAGHVVDEASPGWRLRGRLFLAARVTVSEGQPAPAEPVAAPGDTTAEGPAPTDDPLPDPWADSDAQLASASPPDVMTPAARGDDAQEPADADASVPVAPSPKTDE